MKIDESDAPLLSKYLFSRVTKSKLKDLCSCVSVAKSGTRGEILERLRKSLSAKELVARTEDVRNDIGRYILEAELLELRLSLGPESYKDLFPNSREPMEMLDWYEKLLLAILSKGSKNKSEIINDELFKAFLNRIGGKPEDQHKLSKDFMRWNRRSLVRRGIVSLQKEGWIYSIKPEFREYFRELSKINVEHLFNLFHKSWTGKLWFKTPESFLNLITELKPVRFSRKKAKRVSPDETADSIRILALSDWRVQDINHIFRFVQSIAPVDFILYAGDDLGRFEEEGKNYFSDLSMYTKAQQVLAIIGNDDFYLQKRVLRAKGVHDLYDQTYIYKNFAFVGLEASTSRPALFRHEEEDFKAHLEHQSKHCRNRRLVILSHAPPFGVLDRGIRYANVEEDTHHIGSTALAHFMKSNSVDLVVCGHCHSHGGMMEEVGSATVANVSSHDSPGSKGVFAVIELAKNGAVEVEWHDTSEVFGRESLMQIHGIGPVRAEQLMKCGVEAVSQFAEFEDLTQLAYDSKISEGYLRLLQLKAKSILNEEIYQIRPFDFECSGAIYFDIETDIACKRVWLIGVQMNGRFAQFYANNWEQEEDILKEFSEFLSSNPDRMLISFSGTNFDYRITLDAMQRHGMNTDSLLSRSHTDLSLLLQRCFIFPNQSFALKDLGSFFGYPFKYPDLNGFAVALRYHKHIEDGEPIDPKLLEYNEDDVKTIPFLISEVRSCRRKHLPERLKSTSFEPMIDNRGIPARSTTREDYTCPNCGHFHSSNFAKKRLPIKCYRCRYDFGERNTSRGSSSSTLP